MSEAPVREPTFYEQMHDLTTELFFLSLRIHKAIDDRDQQIQQLQQRIEHLERGRGFIPGTALHATHPDNKNTSDDEP